MKKGDRISMDWEQVLSAVEVSIAVLGFGGVVFSLFRMQQAMRAEAYSKLYEELHEVHRVFIERPGLRPVFYDDQEPSGAKEEVARCFAVAEMFMDIFENVLHQTKGVRKRSKEAWRAYIASMCRSSSFLRRYIRKCRALLDPEDLLEIVDAVERELAS